MSKTKEELFQEQVKLCEGMMRDCGFTLPKIRYTLNKRLRTTIGQCRMIKKDKEYEIELSDKYMTIWMETGEIEDIQHTILHEMCHALPNGYNHGDVWKNYVNVINGKFGYNISRLHSLSDETKVVRSKMDSNVEKVAIGCGCGTWYYKPTSRYVKNVSDYRCGNCKGKLKLLEK